MTLSVNISIPASHAGGDLKRMTWMLLSTISIPASHAGGDAAVSSPTVWDKVFQSPPPMREATSIIACRPTFAIISIPASHAGGDTTRISSCPPLSNFNPRLPCGRRHA